MAAVAGSIKLRGGQVWVPWFVLVVGLVTTSMAAWYIKHSNSTREQTRFHGLADAAVDQLSSGTEDYIAALRGASGLFAAVAEPGPDQFDAYVRELNLARRYPALRGVGYAPRVPAARVQAVSEDGRRNISPEFHIWPEDVQTEAYPNYFLEPRDGRERPGLGYNILNDTARRAALELARDTGSAAVTTRLHLLSQAATDPAGAFLIFYPIYKVGVVPTNVSDRRSRISGTVFVAFVADEFFGRIFDSEVRGRARIVVYDKGVSGRELLFDPTQDNKETDDFKPHLAATRDVQIGGRVWTLEMTERRDFDLESGEPLTPFILLGGSGISLVLFAVTRGQALANEAVEKSAAALSVSTEALKASQGRLRRLVDSNLIGVLFCDTDGQIIDGNDEFFRTIGRRRGDYAGPVRISFSDVISEDQLEAQWTALRGLEASRVSPSRETCFKKPDGSPVPALIGLAIVDGSTTDAVAFTIDLTERKQVERELEAAKEAAEAANRSKDQFLAVLSHELRTPLTPVLAATTAAKDDRGLSDDVRAEMEMIHRNVDLEARLIDDLLDLTRIGRGKLQLQLDTVDVNRVIRSAIEVSTADLSMKSIRVELKLSAAVHHVRGDAARLQQVFWNLIKNAVKFTPARGTIVVSTSNIRAEGSQDGQQTLRAQVIDDGLGIEAELLPKIFEAFEQGTIARAQASGGLGLGLAISRGLVEAHGGKVAVASDGVGKGATFTIELPAIAGIPDSEPGGEVPDVGTKKIPLRILLIEDHDDTAKVLQRLLRAAGHKVDVGGCVADALRLSEAYEFDLLISDLGLPDGSGIDVIQGFRERQHSTTSRAIALTGYGAESDVARTVAAGFDEHLTKPISFQNLQLAIDRVIRLEPPVMH